MVFAVIGVVVVDDVVVVVFVFDVVVFVVVVHPRNLFLKFSKNWVSNS